MDVDENKENAQDNQNPPDNTNPNPSMDKSAPDLTLDTTSAVVTPKMEHERMLNAMNKFTPFCIGRGLKDLTDQQIKDFLNIDDNNEETKENYHWKYLAQYMVSNMDIQKDPNYVQEIAIHPLKTFSFSNYEGEVIIPLMNDQLIAETYRSVKLQLSGLHLDIVKGTANMLKERNQKRLAFQAANEKAIESSTNIKNDDTNTNTAVVDDDEHEDEDIDIKIMDVDDDKQALVQAQKQGPEIIPPTKNYYKDEHLWHCPRWAVPIRADIRKFDWAALAKTQLETSARLFDVIMMDPPWRLAGSNPTRGVAIGYDQLPDNIIKTLPITKLQGDNSMIFLWVINAKFRYAVGLLEYWGYKLIQFVTWVKQTVNRRLASGHGYYLQHAKELCLIGVKGKLEHVHQFQNGVCADFIYSERRGQSQKPDAIYEYIERMVPQGYYLEIFARRNNLRDGWISIGNEL